MRGTIGEIAEEIEDFANLLILVLAGPDADIAIDGMYRVMLEIRDRAAILRAAHVGLGL